MHFLPSNSFRCAGRLLAAFTVTVFHAATVCAQSQPAGEAAAQQKITPVTTTVVVHGDINGDYLPESVTVGNLAGLPVKSAPLSATAVTRDLLNDQVARLLSDVVQNDASVEDDYVPVGYYGDYQIRG